MILKIISETAPYFYIFLIIEPFIMGISKFYGSKNFLKNLKNIKINLIYEYIMLKWN